MPDILSGLLTKKDKIASLPEASQRAIWNVAFDQSVAPKLRDAASKGAQLENEDASRERFITSMLGKAQPADNTEYVPSTYEKGYNAVVSAVPEAAGLVAGVAGGAKHFVEKLPDPLKWGGAPLGTENLGKIEGMYDVAKAATSERPVRSATTSVATAVGHQIPALMAYEAGANVVPELAGGVEIAQKAPMAMRAVQALTRTGAGTAAMNLTSPESTSGGTLLAQALGFSVLDMVTRGFFGSMRGGGPDAASLLQHVRDSVIATDGAITRAGIDSFNNASLDIIKKDYPTEFERIAKGERAENVLTVQQQADVVRKAGIARAQEQAVAAKNAKVAKTADKQAVQAQASLAKMQAKAQAKLDMQANRLKSSALQREISAYAKATGKVPAEGSEAMKSLQNGAKAKDIVAQEKAAVVAKVGDMKDTNAAIAMTEAQPKLEGMLKDAQAIAETPAVTKTNQQEAIKFANDADKIAGVENSVAGQRIREDAGIAKPKASVKQKIAAPAEPLAYEQFGVKIDASQWKTPEDVLAGKKDAVAQLSSAVKVKSDEIIAGIRAGSITAEQAKVMQTQLGTEAIKAMRSIEKTKVEGVSRAARDRLRKGASAAEAKRVVGEQQAGAEKLGTSSVGAKMTEQEAIDEVDTLYKIGFGSQARKAVADKIINEVKSAGGGPIDVYDALKEAYDSFKKGGQMSGIVGPLIDKAVAAAGKAYEMPVITSAEHALLEDGSMAVQAVINMAKETMRSGMEYKGAVHNAIGKDMVKVAEKGPVAAAEFNNFHKAGIIPSDVETGLAAVKVKNTALNLVTDAQQKGYKVGPLVTPNYFPSLAKEGAYTEAEKRQEMIDYLKATGKASNSAQAAKIIGMQRGTEAPLGRVYHPLETPRKTIPDPTKLRDDLGVMYDYTTGLAEHIGRADVAGQHGEKLEELLGVVRDIDGEAKYQMARRVVADYLGYSYLNRPEVAGWERAVHAGISATTLHLAPVANTLGGVANMVTQAGFTDFLKGFAKYAMNPEAARELSDGSGASLFRTMTEMKRTLGAENQSLLGKMSSKVLMNPAENMIRNERLMRTLGANVGKTAAESEFNKLLRDPGNAIARQRLATLGIDVNTALRRGSLDSTDTAKAAYEFANRTMFHSNAFTLPELWRNSAWGRMATIYKPFLFMQTKFVRDSILKPAFGIGMKQDLRPLIWAAVVFPTLGEIAGDIKMLARGRDPKERPDFSKYPLDRVVDNMSQIGGLGIVSDVTGAVATGMPEQTLGFLTGPVGGNIADLVSLARFTTTPQQAATRDKDRLSFFLRRIPMVGPLVNEATRAPKHVPNWLQRGTLSKVTGLAR